MDKYVICLNVGTLITSAWQLLELRPASSGIQVLTINIFQGHREVLLSSHIVFLHLGCKHYYAITEIHKLAMKISITCMRAFY